MKKLVAALRRHGARIRRPAVGIQCVTDGREARAEPVPLREMTTGAERTRRRSGLSLIEVLMAVVILGTGLAIIIAAASRCVAVARKVRNMETVRELFGRVELEKPIWLEEDIEKSAGQGSFVGEYSGYRWRREVVQIGDEKDGLWEVRTTVSWSERGRENAETVVTYVHWPKSE